MLIVIIIPYVLFKHLYKLYTWYTAKCNHINFSKVTRYTIKTFQQLLKFFHLFYSYLNDIYHSYALVNDKHRSNFWWCCNTIYQLLTFELINVYKDLLKGIKGVLCNFLKVCAFNPHGPHFLTHCKFFWKRISKILT